MSNNNIYYFSENKRPTKKNTSTVKLSDTLADAQRRISFQRPDPAEKKDIPPLQKVFPFLFPSLFNTQPYHHKADRYYIEKDGFPYPVWKKVLDKEETKLEQQTTQKVNVLDFGARGDGKTDDTKAFQRAIGNGRVKVVIPEGVFIVKSIKLPSWTWLEGSGKGKTIIKLHPKAPKRRRLLTNQSYRKGNHHLKIENLSLDWNVERLKKNERTSSGSNFSSCLTLAHVVCGWVKRVEAINAGLHGIDISSPFYTYAGDATRAKGGSKYIWIDEVTGYGFGDDGVTTHHSDHILISNSHMMDPSGRAHKQGFSNSNGFEVDDGSRGVWLIHNSSARCFGGVEIKAHKTAAAASHTYILGHHSLQDNRSFNFRHIGHHLKKDPESKTAYDIIAVHLQADNPVRTSLYKNSAPRALVVSAYKNVVIENLTITGNPEYDYRNQPAIAIQYRARNVCLHNVKITGFQSASSDVKVAGGPQHADSITISNVESHRSAPVAVEVGKHVRECILQGINGKVVW